VEKTAQELAAERFLSRGIIENIEDHHLALACDQLIQKQARTSFKKALMLARRFVKRSAGGSDILRLAAFRVLARMAHMSGSHEQALDAYSQARPLALRDPLIRGRIDRALADVYLYIGNFDNARLSAKRAMATFKKAGANSDLAMAKVNYANLLHRQDRHRDAEKLYKEAADFFEKSGNQPAAARCYYNRANALVQLFDFLQAEKLYRMALQIYEDEGFELDANDVRYGLAWLHMLSGKYHIALLDLINCEKKYREGGDPRGEALCSLDRAEVYLGLGLYGDALDASRASERMFSRLKLRYEHSKAALFRGQAAFALGLRRDARAALERAKQGFSVEKNRGFLGVTHLLAADLANQNEQQQNAEIKAARFCFARAQLPYWEAVCDLRQFDDPKFAKGALMRLAKNKAVCQVPLLFAIWQTITGDYKFEMGDASAARHHWQKAADRLDFVRAQLPPLVLRNAFAHKQKSPHLRLIDSEMEQNPARASAWSERNKTAGLWSRISLLPKSRSGVRQRAEISLNSLASQVAALAYQIGGGSSARGLSGTNISGTLSSLQNKVRDELMAMEKHFKGKVDSTAKLVKTIRQISHRLPIIQFHLKENEIVAFVHYEGKTSPHRYRSGRKLLAEALQRWRFILEGELLSGQLSKISGSAAEQRLWTEIGEWLWAPLEIECACDKILIIPEGELANLPWPALIVDGKHLAEQYRFILSPSIRHYIAACQIETRSDIINIFKGAADDLPQVNAELETLARLTDRSATLFDPCRRGDWPSSGEAQAWHFAGHAVLRADNPFYSFLALEDGPLFAADFRLKDCKVNLVTLAACRSGEQVALPGEESTGLVRSLLEMGARNVIAGHWPISDETAALWMSAFYDKFFNNESLLDAASYAANVVREKYESAYHWAAFSVFGAGNMGDKHE
jgi:tetratricopeptide (TPR) repeat protein